MECHVHLFSGQRVATFAEVGCTWTCRDRSLTAPLAHDSGASIHGGRTVRRQFPLSVLFDLSRRSPASSDSKAKHWRALRAKRQNRRHHHFRLHKHPSPAEAPTVTMGLMDYMEDLYASLTWREVEAEAPESGMYRPACIAQRQWAGCEWKHGILFCAVMRGGSIR